MFMPWGPPDGSAQGFHGSGHSTHIWFRGSPLLLPLHWYYDDPSQTMADKGGGVQT